MILFHKDQAMDRVYTVFENGRMCAQFADKNDCQKYVLNKTNVEVHLTATVVINEAFITNNMSIEDIKNFLNFYNIPFKEAYGELQSLNWSSANLHKDGGWKLYHGNESFIGNFYSPNDHRSNYFGHSSDKMKFEEGLMEIKRIFGHECL
jgi:hypothetical protein